MSLIKLGGRSRQDQFFNPNHPYFVTGAIIGRSALAKLEVIHIWVIRVLKLSSKQIEAIRNASECDYLSESDREVLTKILESSSTPSAGAMDGRSASLKISESFDDAELFVDGASDLKTNTAGIGGVLYSKGVEIMYFAEPLYNKTNNEAEYLALIKGLNVALSKNIKNIVIYADSELIVRQVNGIYKVKNVRMKELHMTASNKLKKIPKWDIRHIGRERNKRADELSKIGLEEAKRQKQ